MISVWLPNDDLVLNYRANSGENTYNGILDYNSMDGWTIRRSMQSLEPAASI